MQVLGGRGGLTCVVQGAQVGTTEQYKSSAPGIVVTPPGVGGLLPPLDYAGGGPGGLAALAAAAAKRAAIWPVGAVVLGVVGFFFGGGITGGVPGVLAGVPLEDALGLAFGRGLALCSVADELAADLAVGPVGAVNGETSKSESSGSMRGSSAITSPLPGSAAGSSPPSAGSTTPASSPSPASPVGFLLSFPRRRAISLAAAAFAAVSAAR